LLKIKLATQIGQFLASDASENTNVLRNSLDSHNAMDDAELGIQVLNFFLI